MSRIHRVIRVVTVPLVALALTVIGASEAFGIRVAPSGASGGGSHTTVVALQGSSPLWQFLAVAAGAVLVTLAAAWLITRVRHAPGHHPSHA